MQFAVISNRGTILRTFKSEAEAQAYAEIHEGYDKEIRVVQFV